MAGKRSLDRLFDMERQGKEIVKEYDDLQIQNRKKKKTNQSNQNQKELIRRNHDRNQFRKFRTKKSCGARKFLILTRRE